MISFHPHWYMEILGAASSASSTLESSTRRTSALFAFENGVTNSKIQKGRALAKVNQVFCIGELDRKELFHPLRIFVNFFFPTHMEISRLRANMKQKYAKQCICQQKQFWYLGGRLFWSFPVCILLFFINYSAFWNEKLFWNEKKPEWKCQRRHPRASSHVLHFPMAVVFFSRKQTEAGIFQEVLTGFFWGEKENNFSKQYPSHPLAL